MALSERLALLVSLDADGAIRGLNKVGTTAHRELGKAENRTDRMAKGFQKAGVGMLGTAGLLGAGLYKAGQSAADLEQAVGGTEAVFKDSSGTIDRFAKDAAKNMGLSERAFREATTLMGGSLKGLGFSVDDAADRSVELTGVAADLAATYGGTTKDAVDALTASFRGEADPAERFNLRLNQTNVNAKAVALGLAESTSNVDAHAKAQATLALIMEQSADAQGQFQRELSSASGQMQVASAQVENAKAALGEAVAPVIADVAGGLASVASGFQSVNDASGGAASKLAAFGTIGLGAAGGLSFVVGKTIEMRKNLSQLTGPLHNATGGLNRMGKAATGLGLVGTAIGLAALGTEMDGFAVSVDNAAGAFSNMTRAEEEETRQLLELAEAAGGLDDLFGQVAESSVPAAERLLEFAEANGLSADQVAELRDVIKQKRAQDVQGTKDQAAYSEQVNEAADATGGLTRQLEEQEDALKGVLDATLAQFDANIGYRRSVDEAEDSLSDLAATQKEHGTDSEEYRDALLDAEAALLDQADAAVRNAEAVAIANGGTWDAKRGNEVYRAELKRLRDALAVGSPLRVALQTYIESLNAIPASVSTSVKTTYENTYASGGQYRRAAGGPVLSGQSYLVGERGPEMFTPTSAGNITPNHELRSSTGGGDTIVIQVGDSEVARIYAEGKTRVERRGFAA